MKIIIDQSFSCLSRFLRKHDYIDDTRFTVDVCDIYWSVFHQKWKAAAKHRTTLCGELKCWGIYMFDIKSWISPFLEEIHGHAARHVLLFAGILRGSVLCSLSTLVS